MNIVIIEDELFAAKRIENLIKEHNANHGIVSRLESVADSIEWFNANPEPDLIFLDIHLEDNLSFAIFDKTQITCPLVFTTATDELAIKAFETKGVDYLHKPIVQHELNKILDKYVENPLKYKKEITKGYFDDLMNRNR